jgi:ubiquinone/menaquinone biosynthesis C-methylase UbiE
MTKTTSAADAKKLNKAATRWNQCVDYHETYATKGPLGPVLDCGCGAGHFVHEGLTRDVEIWGIDQRPSKIHRYRQLLASCKAPEAWYCRCLTASGYLLPFANATFSMITSWWVLEHVPTPSQMILEMVRVARPGGLLVIRAQDARSCWEGHYKIPWLPYLYGPMREIWLEEFAQDPMLHDDLTELIQPQIEGILTSLGCTILEKAAPPRLSVENPTGIATEQQLRETARKIKALWEEGSWLPNPEGLYLVAQKL